MAISLPELRRNESPDERWSHECALVDDHLYLFGGWDESKYFPRNEIFSMNVRREEKKWTRRLTQSRTIPPPCAGARCVVIDKRIYSYGGNTGEGRLGIVYRLDPKTMAWIEVATPIGEKKPHERSSVCLCAIQSRMIMFGGASDKIPRDQLQSGATQEELGWSNDAFEFEFEEGNESGVWSDLELTGTRPKPLVRAAMTTIDQHRALLHGIDVENVCQSCVMNLKYKTWTIIDFNVRISPRWGHTICQIAKQGLEEKSFALLVGGYFVEKKAISDYIYVLDSDNSEAYQINVDQQVGKIWRHTCHCVQNEDMTIDVFVCGGQDWNERLKPIIIHFRLESEILSPRPPTRSPRRQRRFLPSGSEEMMQSQLQLLQRRCAELDKENESVREQLASAERLIQRKDEEIALIRQELTSAAEAAQRRNREEMAVSLRRCQTLEASRDEMKRRLDEVTDVLNINGDEVHLTDQKLGSGAFAAVSVGQWRGTPVAVKKMHDLVTDRHNIAMFQQEVLVCSRLHHPNIMTVCGAVMAEGVPLQMVMELLEGSVDEVLTASLASGAYLTVFEQLSIAMDVTSGISYLHEIRPRPYVHGDIRPSNLLVRKDMKVKVGDLGAAHLIESSRSAGPLSFQYLAPERMPRSDGTASSSTLRSDAYSVGVSLIEIFTGEVPILDMRQTQLDNLSDRTTLFMLCSRMVDRDPSNRMSAQACFQTLKTEFTEIERRVSALGIFAAKRMVKGLFDGETHKVVFLNVFIS